jgi:hypothetical protein
MATSTDYLKLVLPGLGEYVDTWHIPVNANMEAIDAFCMAFGQEIINARGGAASLADFLAVAHNPDGTLLPTASEAEASSSQVYGYLNPDASDFTLNDRISAGDMEVFEARENQPSLRAAMAVKQYLPNQILSGSKDGNGYPSWLGFTANKIQVDGSVELLALLIDGYSSSVRTLKELTLSGGAGLKYAYATFNMDGAEVINGDLSPAAGNGAISTDVSNHAVYFNDATKDFTLEDVRAGDVLELLDSANIGTYIIKAVAPGAIISRLEIIGLFPAPGISGINYRISDPLGVALGFDAAEVPAPGKLYLGEADFDGLAVTAVRARHFKDVFIGEWRAVDVTTTPTFEEIYLHKLGSAALDFSIQVSQANDGSQPVEELDLATLTNTLAVDVTNTLAVSLTNGLVYTPAVFSPGTSTATYTPGSLTGTVTAALTGTVTAALTGAVVMDRAVKVKWDKNRIWVKNVGANVFYSDYDGNPQLIGFIRVVVRKRG